MVIRYRANDAVGDLLSRQQGNPPVAEVDPEMRREIKRRGVVEPARGEEDGRRHPVGEVARVGDPAGGVALPLGGGEVARLGVGQAAVVPPDLEVRAGSVRPEAAAGLLLPLSTCRRKGALAACRDPSPAASGAGGRPR